MSVFRINKDTNYTVMSNHHLRNIDLSLKEKGLLSLMLSLPPEWDYSISGLCPIVKDELCDDLIKKKNREYNQLDRNKLSKEIF